MYNGWANYETWNVVLWANNEEPTYRAMLCRRPYSGRTAREFLEEIFPNGTPDMKGPQDYDEVDWIEVAEAFNEE